MARQPAGKAPLRRRKRIVLGEIRFERRNWRLMGGALASIVLGYILLASGSTTLAPLLLVLGYCFLVPAALLWRPRNTADAPAGE